MMIDILERTFRERVACPLCAFSVASGSSRCSNCGNSGDKLMRACAYTWYRGRHVGMCQ